MADPDGFYRDPDPDLRVQPDLDKTLEKKNPDMDPTVNNSFFSDLKVPPPRIVKKKGKMGKKGDN